MVTVLFKFINASPSRNWLAKVYTLQEIIFYVTAMDRIKYHPRMLSVYLSDMQALEERDPNIRQLFLDGQFSVQINNIPETVKSVDHAGEQENKKMKIQDGLTIVKR